jgi:hypothetical protein
LALKLWQQLALDRFWAERLPKSRKGTRWEQVLFVLACIGHRFGCSVVFESDFCGNGVLGIR